MADILIRGMEMPKHCIDCPLMVDRFDTDACALQSQEANEAFESWEDMRRNCPLLHLPAGHGRLIDADALCKSVLSQCEMVDALGIPDMSHIAEVMKKGLLQEIGDAETIIEAEGGGEDG